MESHTTAPSRASGSNYDASSGRVQLSARLTDRLEKLAKWRISPSLFEFLERGPEVHGGYATVSRAVLRSPQDSELQKGENSSGETVTKSEDSDVEQEGRCENESSRRCKYVAVKKMRILGDITRVLGLSLREAEFLIELEHENVISLEGLVEDVSKDLIWLVFPWEDNGTLKDFIASADWEIPERIWLINDVARGVEYLHSRQPPICHGDLKSINILVNSQYRAVITDFGSARRLVSNDPKVAEEQTKNKLQKALSPEATFCASTNTMAPDWRQLYAAVGRPRAIERREFWHPVRYLGVGVMTNFIPFHNVKDAVVIKRVIQGDLPSISDDTRILLIQELCSLMIKYWSIDPSKRPTGGDCRKSINWMPMIVPKPGRTKGTDGSTSRSPELLMKLGVMYLRQNDYAEASKSFTEALEIQTEIGDKQGRASALWGLGQVHRLQHEYIQAITVYSEALQIRTEIGDRLGRAEVLLGLASVHRLRGEYSEAIAFHSEALQIWTESGEKQRRADALAGLASVHRLRAEYSESITFCSEALQIRTEIGDRRGRADALCGLASVRRFRGEYSEAVTLYSESLQIRTDIGDRQRRADALSGLASVYRLQGEYDQAITFYSETLQIRDEVGDRRGKADALWGLAEVHRLQDRYGQAVTLYSESLQIRTEIGDRRGIADALSGLASVHQLRGEYDQAIDFYSEALQIRNEINDRRGRASTLSALASVHRLLRKNSQTIISTPEPSKF